jgi:hypothetical protein
VRVRAETNLSRVLAAALAHQRFVSMHLTRSAAGKLEYARRAMPNHSLWLTQPLRSIACPVYSAAYEGLLRRY